MKLTGNRVDDKKYLLILRRQNVLTAGEYDRKVKVLERREAKIQEAFRKEKEARKAAEKVKQEKLKKLQGQAVKAGVSAIKGRAAQIAREREQDKRIPLKAKKIAANELLFTIRASANGEAVVRQIWKTLGGEARLIIGDKTGVLIDKIINRPAGRSDKDYKDFRMQFKDGYDSDWIFEFGDVLMFVRPSPIKPELLIQRFRDGKVSHCVFRPIIRFLEAKLEDASPGSAKRHMQRIAALREMEEEYLSKSGENQGVHQDDMEKVCKVAGLKVVLEDIFKDKLMEWNSNGKVGSIRFRNTRENHVESGIVITSDPVQVSEEQMMKVYSELKKSGDWFRVEGDFKNNLPSKLETLTGALQLVDEDKEICKAFDKELGIINYKVNARKFPELNAFLKAGRIVNCWNCDLNGGEADGCVDMPKAYAQFKKCDYYSGFLGQIHQFRAGSFDAAFVREHLGFYGVRVLGGEDWLLQKLGMTVGTECVLFGPELLFLMDEGVQFEIFQGAWGSRFDFEFPSQMLKKGRYTWWSGKLGMERDEVRHTVPGSRQWAEHLAAQGHSVYHWSNDNLVTIKRPAPQVFTGHHILGAITAYLRIQMIKAMRMFQPHQLVRVVADGIYYRGEKPAGVAWFGDKPIKPHNFAAPWYKQEEIPKFPEMGQILGHSLLTGQGGSGKTYSVFANPGFHNLLYVSPSHLLGQDVREKFPGSKYTTINKLVGIDCRPYREEFRVPSVIFVDEITQIPAEWVDKVFDLYPESLVLLAGDIDSTGRWYQCRSGDGQNWNEIWNPLTHPSVKVIEFLEDRRSRDPELKELKLRIRQKMRECTDDSPVMEMLDWSHQNLSFVSKIEFKEGDTVIAATHKTNKKVLDAGIVSGWYRKGGDVAYSEPEGKGWEKRGSFTTHSYQGKTIETGTVWIVVDDMFEYAMLYTAVSRVVNFSQLRFVRRV